MAESHDIFDETLEETEAGGNLESFRDMMYASASLQNAHPEATEKMLADIRRESAQAVREAEAEMRRNAEPFRNNRYIG